MVNVNAKTCASVQNHTMEDPRVSTLQLRVALAMFRSLSLGTWAIFKPVFRRSDEMFAHIIVHTVGTGLRLGAAGGGYWPLGDR